jgi:hypothetical protein
LIVLDELDEAKGEKRGPHNLLRGYETTDIGNSRSRNLIDELWNAGCLYTLHKQREMANWRASVCT